jgi:microcystin-dependent protein
MADPYIGEIRMFAGSFAPSGWAICDGSLLPIASNTPLFALIGTTYGGDGQSLFALPDLRGRVPVHQGPGFVLGQMAGTEQVTLNAAQMPAHSHGWVAASSLGTASAGPGDLLASSSTTNHFSSSAPSAQLAGNAVTPAGGGQPHENRAPYLAVNFIIALYGIFPSS